MNKSDDTTNLPRREWMKAAAAGAGLAMAPAANLFAGAPTFKPAPKTLSVGVGYARIASAQNVGKGTAIVDAASLPTNAASYQLRVLSASTNAPISIDAQYPHGAEHHFWSAWNQGAQLQRSSPSTLRWWAGDRSSLSLLVWYGGSSMLASIPAHPGTYAMVVAGAGQALPAWTNLSLSGSGNGATLKRSGQVLALPYFVFDVETIDA
jgi:hypothetical protein